MEQYRTKNYVNSFLALIMIFWSFLILLIIFWSLFTLYQNCNLSIGKILVDASQDKIQLSRALLLVCALSGQNFGFFPTKTCQSWSKSERDDIEFRQFTDHFSVKSNRLTFQPLGSIFVKNQHGKKDF